MTTLELDLQIASQSNPLPSYVEFNTWIAATLPKRLQEATLTIRIVDEPEMIALNNQYRHQRKPTNVLSFPFENPPELNLPILGDIVICAPVVIQEAHSQAKVITAHWAHLTIHGCLHLLGYDHTTEAEAQIMEPQEINIMAQLGYPNPYGVTHPHE